MSQPVPASAIFLVAGAGLILLVLLGVFAWTTRTGMRLRKLQPPKMRYLLGSALLQIILGGLTVAAARLIHNDPWLDIGAGLGVAILSGLFFIKWMLKTGWKLCLRVWVIAALLQLVLVPVCAWIMAVGWLMLYFLLYPPRL